MSSDRGRRKIATLREAVASFMETSGLSKQTVSDQIGRAWRDILGAETAKHTRLSRTLTKGTLTVEVDSSALLSELSGFRKAELIAGLQERVKRKHIEDIRFRLGSGF